MFVLERIVAESELMDPVVVCGVSHDAIANAIIATNKMRFIIIFFKLIDLYIYSTIRPKIIISPK